MHARVRRIKPYHWFIAPALLFVGAFTLYPAIYGVTLSFTNIHFAYVDSRFVGIENYVRLFEWRPLSLILFNSFLIMTGTVFFQMTFGLFTALVLNKYLFGRGFVRSLAILPWAIPSVIVGILFKQLFSGSRIGLANSVLNWFGQGPIAWLTDTNIARLVLIFALTWRGTAFSVILQSAGLQTIPHELYESATIDGASPWRVFWHITFPLLRPTLLVNLIMASAFNLNTLDIPMALTGGGPAQATEILSLSVYRQGFEFLDASFAATIATFMLILNIGLTIFYLYFVKQEDDLKHQ